MLYKTTHGSKPRSRIGNRTCEAKSTTSAIFNLHLLILFFAGGNYHADFAALRSGLLQLLRCLQRRISSTHLARTNLSRRFFVVFGELVQRRVDAVELVRQIPERLKRRKKQQ